MVTKSSTESELVTLDEALTHGQYIQDQLEQHLRINRSDKVICYQDNQTTISMIHTGGNFSRTKHILVRLNYIKDLISTGRYSLYY